MPILTRLAALGAMSILAACGTSTTVDSPDAGAEAMFSRATVFDPATTDGEATNLSEIVTDDPDGGIVGYMGLADGTLESVKYRISLDGSTAYVSIGGAPEIAFTGGSASTYSTWRSVEGDYLEMRLFGDDENIQWLNTSAYGGGYAGLHTPVEDLPTGTVAFSGLIDIRSGSGPTLFGNMQLDVDFADGSIDGVWNGNLRDNPFEEGPSFESAISGAISGNQVAMSTTIDTEELSGTVEAIGGVFNDGTAINGAAAGTVNDTTYGGYFYSSSAPR